MPEGCFGVTPPMGARLIERISHNGQQLLARITTGQTLSENERDYLDSVKELLNAILWELTALPDYFQRGIFAGEHGERAFNLCMLWTISGAREQRIAYLRRMRNAVASVADDSPGPRDEIAILNAVQFLSEMHTKVARIYNL